MALVVRALMTLEPSRGGIGSRLKTASSILKNIPNTSHFLKVLVDLN